MTLQRKGIAVKPLMKDYQKEKITLTVHVK